MDLHLYCVLFSSSGPLRWHVAKAFQTFVQNLKAYICVFMVCDHQSGHLLFPFSSLTVPSTLCPTCTHLFYAFLFSPHIPHTVCILSPSTLFCLPLLCIFIPPFLSFPLSFPFSVTPTSSVLRHVLFFLSPVNSSTSLPFL